MASLPKFAVSSISHYFTFEWHFYSGIIATIPGVVAPQNPRRYAVCFINNDIATVRLSTMGDLGALGLCVKPDEQVWLNIKDHAGIVQAEWTAYGTTGSERVTVIEIIQVP